jgi:hypothetical protein
MITRISALTILAIATNPLLSKDRRRDSVQVRVPLRFIVAPAAPGQRLAFPAVPALWCSPWQARGPDTHWQPPLVAKQRLSHLAYITSMPTLTCTHATMWPVNLRRGKSTAPCRTAPQWLKQPHTAITASITDRSDRRRVAAALPLEQSPSQQLPLMIRCRRSKRSGTRIHESNLTLACITLQYLKLLPGLAQADPKAKRQCLLDSSPLPQNLLLTCTARTTLAAAVPHPHPPSSYRCLRSTCSD